MTASSVFNKIKRSCPDVDDGFLRDHLFRLAERYFRSFDEKEICRHVQGLFGLSKGNPVEALFSVRKDGTVDCTVLAFDYPAVFSLIAGILAGTGYGILSGDVFTYSHSREGLSNRPKRKKAVPFRLSPDPHSRRRIIDHFSGRLDTALSFASWTDRVRFHLIETIRLLECGDESSVRAAKHRVNEMVVGRLTQNDLPLLYPVRIELDPKHEEFTRMKVVSEDTPAFLYALANALSLHGIAIEHVRIRTIQGRIEDEIDLVDAHGRAIKEDADLDRIKLCVLLTKQFTYFLGKSPDPYTALSRFEFLLEELLRMPERNAWLEMVKNPHALQDLAKLLGASDFLWEDFIRIQYESLLPMLLPRIEEGIPFSNPMEAIGERIEREVSGAASLEEQSRRLNAFKDREIFLIDLDQILNPEMDFQLFAEKLTRLAENVVNAAVGLVYGHLVERYGEPRSVAGLKAVFSVLGLGKLGGSALGYASDIELLFVYSDNGRTDGPESIGNAEFFDRLVKEVNLFIQGKREGIFHLDLRLRPYGEAGPLACSLESFCRYYGPGGSAQAYERLALVRMRAFGGDRALGARLERLRDEFVYSSGTIDLKEIHSLREKQFQSKAGPGKPNAKFSPGGLVDLEYGVQLLQATHGGRLEQLRTPRIREALMSLDQTGVLSTREALQLHDSYIFFRRLINGMRMMRGSAKDLFLPLPDSPEYRHLARRMGYEQKMGLEAGAQLRVDFETHSASVRAFVEKHFGRDSLPGPGAEGVADLILSDALPEGLRDETLVKTGFRNASRAYVNLKNLAGEGSQRSVFARLAVLACDILMTKPDPDMALNNWERFIHSLPSPESHYNTLMYQPMRLEMLLSIFAGSQFLADTLVRNPGFLEWVLIPEVLNRTRKRGEREDELRRAAETCLSHEEWLNKLRRFRRREILRIGTRDICLGVSEREVMAELSFLAEAVTQAALEKVWTRLKESPKNSDRVDDCERRFCVLAFGKLGGSELNYSSDIDLLGIYEPSLEGADENFEKQIFGRAMENLCADLSCYTEEGYVYRVDLRLRPYGRSGELVSSLPSLLSYYQTSASPWEIQSLLKMRPISGNVRLGYRFSEQIRPTLLERRDKRSVADSIDKMRRTALQGVSGWDVKEGLGGLRDVEFLVQGLQLIHAPDKPFMISENTLTALEMLGEAGILPRSLTVQLQEDYSFLRRIEHLLQIMEDRQTHALPKDDREMDSLARRMLGNSADSSCFIRELNSRLKRVRDAYGTYLLKGKGWGPSG